MGLLGFAVDEGVIRLADVLLSAVGIVVAIWIAVHWSPSVSKD